MEEDGLYWKLEARLNAGTGEILRLYGVTGLESEPFGVFVPGAAGFCLHRRLSRRAVPAPPERWTAGGAEGAFRPWVGMVEGEEIRFALLAPADEAEPDGAAQAAEARQLLALPADCPPLPLAEYGTERWNGRRRSSRKRRRSRSRTKRSNRHQSLSNRSRRYAPLQGRQSSAGAWIRAPTSPLIPDPWSLLRCYTSSTSSTGQWSEPKISWWIFVSRIRSRRRSETTK